MKLLLNSAVAMLLISGTAVAADSLGESPISMRGLDLYMHSEDPTYGELEDPTFWVHAERGQLSGEQRVWSLENASAVIYRSPEDDVLLEAQSGIFDQPNQTALLRGGVRARTGALTVTLDDLEWDNKSRVAYSDSQAAVTDGINSLTGESVKIYPADDTFALGSGKGRLQLAGSRNAPMPVVEEPADDSSMEYESIEVKWQGEIVGSLDGTMRRITDGAHLEIHAKDPANDLTVKADQVEFEYREGETGMPSRMTLTGNTELSHKDGTVRADKADLDFVSGEAVFTGNPTFGSEQIRGVETTFIRLNLDTREFVMGPGRIEEIQLNPTDDSVETDDES